VGQHSALSPCSFLQSRNLGFHRRLDHDNSGKPLLGYEGSTSGPVSGLKSPSAMYDMFRNRVRNHLLAGISLLHVNRGWKRLNTAVSGSSAGA
jgi:hypothetical protein